MRFVPSILAALFVAAFTSISFVPQNVHAAEATPDYWRCTNRIGGAWAFGRAPAACDASAFGDDRSVWDRFNATVFRENRDETQERKRYMTDVHAVLRDAAAHYLRRRKSNVTSAEIAVFRQAFLALAHQESYWTHYRYASDSRLKMMRGDYGHGHGLMQIDDRWHFANVKKGDAWDLMKNITSALELYFSEWQSAATAKCVRRADDYQSRARAAYSAYNGGSGKICRWTDPNDKWARNDKGFWDKMRASSWNTFVTDANQAAPFDVGCALDGSSDCFAHDGQASNEFFTATRAGRSVATCWQSGASAECVSDVSDLVCLRSLGAQTDGARPDLVKREVATLSIHDRHSLCRTLPNSPFGVGDWVRAKVAINLRSEAAGGWIGVISQNEMLEILDFEIRNDAAQTRYYRVRRAGGATSTSKGVVEGWIFAGRGVDDTNAAANPYAEYLELLTAPALQGLIPRGQIRVVVDGGINLRSAPGGEILGVVAQGQTAQIVSRHIVGDDNSIYLQVDVGGNGKAQGYIYVGRLRPSSSIHNWVQVLANGTE